ncbi:hypothetical protein [Curtobacterium sp. L1-20]
MSTSMKEGIRSLFGFEDKGDRSAVWGIRGAGLFFVLFGLAVGALAIFTM